MKLNRVDLNLLPVLSEILRERSVTKAASNLGKTQPAISLALQKLRRNLNDELLVRVGREMRLTPRGEELAVEVEELMLFAHRVLEPKEFEPKSLTSQFAIGGIDYLLFYLSPLITRIVKQAAPDVSLKFVTIGRNWERDLEVGNIDLALVPLGGIQTQTLKAKVLYEDAVRCVASEMNTSVSKKISLANFLEANQVIFDRGDGLFEAINKVYRTHPELTKGAIFTPHIYITIMIVAFSNYLSLVPENMALTVQGRLPIKLLNPPISIDPIKMAMVWSPRYDKDAAHTWMRSVINNGVVVTKKQRPADFEYTEF
ncbi:MAG: LysR family transcriptional regulator [Pseudomonadota bacterium]